MAGEAEAAVRAQGGAGAATTTTRPTRGVADTMMMATRAAGALPEAVDIREEDIRQAHPREVCFCLCCCCCCVTAPSNCAVSKFACID